MMVDVGSMMSSADPAPLNVIQSSSSSLPIYGSLQKKGKITYMHLMYVILQKEQ
jgi:hypothetical protein